VFLTAVSENVAPLKHTNQPINQSINQLGLSSNVSTVYIFLFVSSYIKYSILENCSKSSPPCCALFASSLDQNVSAFPVPRADPVLALISR
jgi:hypothetical protein